MPVSAAVSLVAEDSSFTPLTVYLWIESPAEITNIYYCMDSSIVANSSSAAVELELLDWSSVL